jgi:magnesium-transporting ATPase (P-type)
MLNKEGHITLMCGDGTNDVGSLKRANIGLAIINNKPPSKEDK